jgi:hypothetical protein
LFSEGVDISKSYDTAGLAFTSACQNMKNKIVDLLERGANVKVREVRKKKGVKK